MSLGDFDLDAGADPAHDGAMPVWAAFGDLMAGTLGAFALILVCAIGMQIDLSERLAGEARERTLQAQRLQTLEQALADPLAGGRVTLTDGRIGISGSVLFAFNSDDLQPEGRQLLQTLVGPLNTYLHERGEILMVSGFTDDRPMRDAHGRYVDNWELSAKRALTVTRALIDAGLPSSDVFAAAFGAEQAVASNADAAGRARNRRVEMAPMARVPRTASDAPG
ncbi:MAG: OmpA family protein [Burkholderiaceae bacterium]